MECWESVEGNSFRPGLYSVQLSHTTDASRPLAGQDQGGKSKEFSPLRIDIPLQLSGSSRV